MPHITQRPYSPETCQHLINEGLHPVLARIYAARNISGRTHLEYQLAGLLPYDSLKNIRETAAFLADAIWKNRRILVVADYDSDGATACAVAMKALAAFGACVDYLVPNRFEYGYGLTPEIVRLARTRNPEILLTVDNGIASLAGVAEAHALGMEVVITDHHLPGDALPATPYIVNPNQPGCSFPAKSTAGVGVIFYVMLALRAELRSRGHFNSGAEPKLVQWLDLVALGTVADVVRLEDNNRILVAQGLKRIRSGQAAPGLQAIFQAAGRYPARAGTYDLGFVVGPRLNAAGRLDDMTRGIECLLAQDHGKALELARQLDTLNRERREIEVDMHDQALADLADVGQHDTWSLCLYRQDWHQGVIGILASRLKDKFHRPAIAFAPGNPGEIKGSGRSIPGLHLRDAIDRVAKRDPMLVKRFGGHAAAAGLTIAADGLERFAGLFEEAVREMISPADLERQIETDGILLDEEIDPELAEALSGEVWGQGFPEPLFEGDFRVEAQRVVGERHLKLRLAQGSQGYDAMLFHRGEPLPGHIRAAYTLNINEFNGSRTLQLTLKHWEARE